MTNLTVESRYRDIFRRVHAHHPACLDDEWISRPCADAGGQPVDRPIVWSRRNGPWQQHEVLWIGAAPGNAGGMGTGDLGAHGTRIPFGGDIAGANLDALLGSVGLDRNHTFIAASLNQLPVKGGGEPTLQELLAPVGKYPSSIALVHDTILAAGPRLVVALGNVALRTIVAALRTPAPDRLPSLAALEKFGLRRNHTAELAPLAHASASQTFEQNWNRQLPRLLWLTHPSAQNMSPFARIETLFHTRMLDSRHALQSAVRQVLDWKLPAERLVAPEEGIYALPEWRERIAPKHRQLDALWRDKGV